MKPFRQWMLWLWAGLLAVLLCLLFLPFSPVGRGISVLVVTIVVIFGLARAGHRSAAIAEQRFADLPDESYRLPVVLVCGDTASWPQETTVYLTPQGCWLKVANSLELRDIVRDLLWQRPGWAGQLAVMVNVSPALHADTTALAAKLHEMRWQITRLRRAIRRSVPLLLAGQMASAVVREPLWQALLPGEPVRVWQDGLAPCTVASWTAQDESGVRLQQQAMLNVFSDWFATHVTAAFTDDNPDVPPVMPYAVLFQQTQHQSGVQPVSLWQQWLIRQTALKQVSGWLPTGADEKTAPAVPDFLLPLLPKGAGITPRQKMAHHALTLFTLAAFAALCASGWNNRQLVHRLAFDIRHYYAIPMKDSAPKAKAVAILRQDAAQLNDWSRNGEPPRLGLGLYQGERLRLPLLDAIKTYVPPPPPTPRQTPKIVRLDSMSLFDSGKSALKPGSTKVLVNSLVGIKARPGWLIVVAGHTDNTGNPQLNQTLSLHRAEAVRNWMRDTGDVPESCFAVQGYGESRPAATNDTPEGRALNRRVEISLVPQADACRMPGNPHTSPQDGDVSQHNGE